MLDAPPKMDQTAGTRAVRSSGRAGLGLVLVLAAYVLMGAPAVARAQQSQGEHHGVCRNPFGDCLVQDITEPCTDTIDCLLKGLEIALFTVAFAFLAGLAAEFLVPTLSANALAEAIGAEAVAAVEAEAAATAAEATVVTAAADVTVATAAAGTVATAAAEATVTTAAAEATVTTAAAEATVTTAAAEGTVTEAAAAEATTEATAEATTELPTTLSGHGNWPAQNGFGVMPEGTYLQFASGEGQPLANSVGRILDVGMEPPGGFSGGIGPGELYPDYQLSPPGNLSIAGNPNVIGPGVAPVPGQPNIVSTPMNLSDILQPNMGKVFWAACRGWAGVV